MPKTTNRESPSYRSLVFSSIASLIVGIGIGLTVYYFTVERADLRYDMIESDPFAQDIW